VDHNAEQTLRRRSLIDALTAMRDGDLSQTRMARLSDLSRDGARTLVREWPTIPEDVRIGIVRRCDELSEERVDLDFRRALRVALDDSSAVVRQLAIGGLWEDESAEMLGRLRAMLDDDPSPDVRAEAAASLVRYSRQAAVGPFKDESAQTLRDDLIRVARDEAAPYAVRRRALESLGPFAADAEVAEAISDGFDSGDHGLQCSAVHAMGLSHDPRWLPAILNELENDDPELRFEAARAAGLLGSTDALPLLLDAARDDDAEVRHAAIGAIGQIGGRGAVRALERLAEDAGEADFELIESAIEDVNTLLEPFQQSS